VKGELDLDKMLRDKAKNATETKNKYEYILVSKHWLHITQINVHM
jgi:hypothetical protein